MSKEAWTLVGVVVGALLAGGAQILAGWLTRAHDKAMVTRSDRRQAYTQFIGAVSETYPALHVSGPILRDGEAAQIDEGHRASLATSRGALERMSVAHAWVQLIAPPDTISASVSLQGATLAFMFGDDEETVKKLVAAQAEFTVLAKRDLEMPGAFRGLTEAARRLTKIRAGSS